MSAGSGQRRDQRDRERYAPVFDTIEKMLRELRHFQARNPGVNGQGEVLTEAMLSLREQLRQAIRQGASEDAELLTLLQETWGRVRARLGKIPEDGSAPSILSARELEVLRGVAGGLANKQIAAQLGISARTVRNHLSNIYQKLGISGRAEAAVRAVKLGLLEI